MSLLLQCFLVLVFLVASALFSGLETGGYMLNRLSLRARSRAGDPAAIRLQKLLHDAHLFIFTVLIGNNIAIYLLSRQVTHLYMQHERFAQPSSSLWSAEAAATLSLMLPLFLFGELLPKNLFRTRADTLMYYCSGALSFFQWLFHPVSVVLKAILHGLTGGRVRAEALSSLSLSLDGLRDYFVGDAPQKPLTPHQHGMMDKLVAMHQVAASEVMEPRASIVRISDRASVRQTLELMSARNVEQVMICRKGRKSFCGIVQLRDLMRADVKLESPVRLRSRKAVRIPAAQALPETFRQLRSSVDGIALVVDRASRVIGIVRLRDVAAYLASHT